MGGERRALEGVAMSAGFWHKRRVMVTGHTGFKGGWLALWLHHAGAEVHGYALAPPTTPNVFAVARIGDVLESHTIGDVRDASALREAVRAASPEVVFHLAAQSLVRPAYREPVETYATNVMGTVHLLEAVRQCEAVRAIVNVTTDKCYENREWHWGYRESDPLGGVDPYASSKACAELVTAAYRESFLNRVGIGVATTRAGNVIGGGDWAEDRLVPDFFRAVDEDRVLEIRFADATRPWQHVLEPLSGYVQLAERLLEGDPVWATAWNFGPGEDDAVSVRALLQRLARKVPTARWRESPVPTVHEAGYLKLDSSRARQVLGWRPRWNLEAALDKTVEWHQAWRSGVDIQGVCLAQIQDYQSQIATPDGACNG